MSNERKRRRARPLSVIKSPRLSFARLKAVTALENVDRTRGSRRYKNIVVLFCIEGERERDLWILHFHFFKSNAKFQLKSS